MYHVTIVDDHALFREGLKQVLQRTSDIRVVGEAGSVPEALRLLATTPCDVVLLDLSLRDGSGFDILRHIVQESPHPAVLILSMHSEEQYATRMLRAGARGYITKESAGDELITAIRKVGTGGRYISTALAEHLATSVSLDSDKPPHHQLSNREFQVFRMIVSGMPLKDIAESLTLSEKTITTYRTRILEKLGVKNNVELVRYAYDNHVG